MLGKKSGMNEKLSISEMRFETLTTINPIIGARYLEPPSDSSLKLQISIERYSSWIPNMVRKNFFNKKNLNIRKT